MTSSTENDHSDHPPAIFSSESVDRQERGDPYGTDHHPTSMSSESVEKQVQEDPYYSETSEELLNRPTKNLKPNKNEIHETERCDPLYSDIPEWLQEFRQNLADDRVAECRDSHASSSHELSLEPTRSADFGKNSVFSHFPKDRNCDICLKTKNYKGFLQKTHWRSSTSSWQFWWLDNGRSQSPEWGTWISK